MLKVKVLRRFWDIKERRTRYVGSEFVTTDARALEIKGSIPDYVEVVPVDESPKAPEDVPETPKPTVATQDVGTTHVEEPQEPETAHDETEATDYSAMTVTELKALCAERGIEVPKRAKKAHLVELLEG